MPTCLALFCQATQNPPKKNLSTDWGDIAEEVLQSLGVFGNISHRGNPFRRRGKRLNYYYYQEGEIPFVCKNIPRKEKKRKIQNLPLAQSHKMPK